jgi:SAM-dependent methyltransferase
MSFADQYAQFYDLFYKDKDYPEEVSFLEKVFERFGKGKVERILDLACGTGGHALALSERGFKVTGVDLSPKMLSQAKVKSRQKGLAVDFKPSPMQKFSLGQTFDAVIVMFSAINYLIGYQDLKETLRRVHQHLREGGLFYFDCWNGLAVIDHFDPYREKVVQEGELKIRRISRTSVDPVTQLCRVDYQVEMVKKDKPVDRFQETHQLKFFFVDELRNYLTDAGFDVLLVAPFLKFAGQITKDRWDINFIARKRADR